MLLAHEPAVLAQDLEDLGGRAVARDGVGPRQHDAPVGAPLVGEIFFFEEGDFFFVLAVIALPSATRSPFHVRGGLTDGTKTWLETLSFHERSQSWEPSSVVHVLRVPQSLKFMADFR